MAISNYSELQDAVARWLNRDDLTDHIPDFIRLAEAEISRQLRARAARRTLTITGATVDWPSDVAEVRTITISSAAAHKNLPLGFMSPTQLDEHRASNTTAAQPRFYALDARKLLFSPSPDGTYSAVLRYLAKLTPLSDAAPTNDELTNHPDLYLYGTLLQTAPFLEHDERVPLWQGLFDKAVEQANNARKREEYGGALPQVRLPQAIG